MVTSDLHRTETERWGSWRADWPMLRAAFLFFRASQPIV
jgi:hypothetical protein